MYDSCWLLKFIGILILECMEWHVNSSFFHHIVFPFRGTSIGYQGLSYVWSIICISLCKAPPSVTSNLFQTFGCIRYHHFRKPICHREWSHQWEPSKTQFYGSPRALAWPVTSSQHWQHSTQHARRTADTRTHTTNTHTHTHSHSEHWALKLEIRNQPSGDDHD